MKHANDNSAERVNMLETIAMFLGGICFLVFVAALKMGTW